jgi:nicotinate-nucleotide pyrophosphorylase (carboxylating)
MVHAPCRRAAFCEQTAHLWRQLRAVCLLGCVLCCTDPPAVTTIAGVGHTYDEKLVSPAPRPNGPTRAATTLPTSESWKTLLETALAEDIGSGDVTSRIIFDAKDRAVARIEAREPLVVCGLTIAAAVFESVDAALEIDTLCSDGDSAVAYQPLMRISGSVRSVLTAERTALNFLGRLCGIATHVRRYVDEVDGTGTAIVDTRKTLPGWRVLDKYAVRAGGGVNHRMGLYDGVLLKDNHAAAAGSLVAAVTRALEQAPDGVFVQVEVQSHEEARQATAAGADFLLLDNLDPETTRAIVGELKERATLESSGGITLENVRAYAETGVHRISIGALTHSAPNSDLSLEIDSAGGVPK